MSFDISAIDEAAKTREAGVEIELLHPKTGESTGAFITVAAYSSERVKERARAIVKQWEKRASQNSKFRPGVDEQEYLAKATVCAAIIGWRGIEDGGKEWPCSPENVEKLAADPAVAKQIDEAAGTEALFFGA